MITLTAGYLGGIFFKKMYLVFFRTEKISGNYKMIVSPFKP